MPEDLKNITWPGWETVKLIGRGSFGAVYEIQRDIFGDVEKAALKVITIPQNASDIDELYSEGYDDESITSTFRSHLQSIVAEYSMMRKMGGCVNIVACDDVRYVQHDDGFGWDVFIKMELLTSLLKALPQEIPEEAVVNVGKDICTALVECKKHGVVHRDIKPQNIFMSENGTYKLGDFGIAKTVEKTMGGTKIGTYKYMAPEVYNNQPYGSSADIYSLGLVLYWLLNERRMPFMPLPPEKVKAGAEEETRNRRLSGEALPPPAHGSDKLKQIVLKACAYDPKGRYASAEEMLQALQNMNAGEELRRKREQEERERQRKALEDQERLRAAQAAEQERQRKAQEELQRQQKASEDQERLRAAQAAEPERLRKAQEEQRQEEATEQQTDQMPAKKEKKSWAFAALACAILIVFLIACFADGASQGNSGTDYSETLDPVQDDAAADAWKNNVLMADESIDYDGYCAIYGEDVSYFDFEDYKAEQPDFRMDIPRNQIRTVRFFDTLESASENAWDVSAAQDGSVLAWTVPATGYDDLFDLCIAGEGGVNGAKACTLLFDCYTNLEEVHFNGNFHTDDAVEMRAMFWRCENLTQVDVECLNTSHVENMHGMFGWCRSFRSLDVSSFDTSSVEVMSAVFAYCSSLAYLNLENFDTSSVTSMNALFDGCSSLTELDLSHFDTSSVTDMHWMFRGCSSLTSLDVGNFDTSSVTDMERMFQGCSSLQSLDLSGFDMSSVVEREGFVDGVPEDAIIGNPWEDNVLMTSGEPLDLAPIIAEDTNAAIADESNAPLTPRAFDIATVSAGSYHTVGLKADGTVVAVGLNDAGQCSVSDWTDIVAVTAGTYHTVGLKADGTVVAVGRNYNRQCSVSDWTDIVTISAGAAHTVGLTADGTVVATGLNERGECNVSDWINIVAVAAGESHTVGLRSDGTVVAVGENKYGECDVSNWSNIVAIAAAQFYTVGLKADGTVVAVGININGQCNVSDWTDIIAIFAGCYHTVGLKADGTVVAIGRNDYDQCNVSNWSNIIAVSSGGLHTVGLKADGTVVAVGWNSDGQCDVSDWTDIRVTK